MPYRISLQKIGNGRFGDAVLLAKTKENLRKKVGKHLEETFPQQYNNLSEEQSKNMQMHFRTFVEEL